MREKNYLVLRERQVLEGILAFKSNKQIADELNIAKRTVCEHSIHLYRKLGAKEGRHSIWSGEVQEKINDYLSKPFSVHSRRVDLRTQRQSQVG